jgi:hypothetical protein
MVTELLRPRYSFQPRRQYLRNFGFSIISLALTLGTGAACAADLNLGGNYTQNIYMDGTVVANGDYGGGPIAVSYLDGTQLAWVYCVDMIDVVYVPADYTQTTVTNNGTVTATQPSHAVTTGVVNNAGAISWLLNTYAGSATTTTQQAALQAAIWHEVYSGAEYLDTTNNSAAVVSQYNADLAALGSNTDPLSDVDWFTPGVGNSTTYQALVGPGPGFGTQNFPSVPEPSSILLLATVVLGIMRLLKQKLATGGQS